MANIKRMEQLTGWLEYKLLSDLLDPPVLKVRLRPLDAFNMESRAAGPGGHGVAAWANIRTAVAAWDITEAGVPVEVTSDNKELYLRPLIAEMVEGRSLLGLTILEDAQNRALFLKN